MKNSDEYFTKIMSKVQKGMQEIDVICFTTEDGHVPAATINESVRLPIQNAIVIVQKDGQCMVWQVEKGVVKSCPDDFLLFISSPWDAVGRMGSEDYRYVMYKNVAEMESEPIVVLGVVEIKGYVVEFLFDLQQKQSGYLYATLRNEESSDIYKIFREMWALGRGDEDEPELA